VQLEFEIARLKKTVALNAASLGSSNVQGAVLVLHDISELRRLERMRRDFASNVSHELKTPLTSIQAYADTLLDGALEDSGQNRTFLERIIQQSQRLQALIGDLLSLSKIETQSEMFDIQPVCVDEAIQSCADGHLAVAAGKGVDLQWAAVEGLRVMCDPEGLGQILDNLVDNALNYTAAEGHVSIRSRREGECCVIEVEDSGIGISREQQSRIFERFYRADKARSREVGGTGLGLAIVKHLSQAFGGSVSVTSELGAGSIFQVRLPLAESSAPDSDNP
jgi:two-component system phosphate regulon sensor histidine kinase PhoR